MRGTKARQTRCRLLQAQVYAHRTGRDRAEHAAEGRRGGKPTSRLSFMLYPRTQRMHGSLPGSRAKADQLNLRRRTHCVRL